MEKEEISRRNLFFLFVIFMIGNNLIIGFPGESGQDTWIALLLGLVFIVPLMLLYSRLVRLMPGKNFYQMAEAVLGKIGGTIVGIVFFLYCLTAVSMTLFSFPNFVRMVALRHTHFYIIVLLLLLAVYYLAWAGAKTMGRISLMLLIIMVLMIVVMTIASAKKTDPKNLLPILNHAPMEILRPALIITVLPFGDMAVTLGFADSFDKSRKTGRAYVLAAIAAMGYLLVVFLRACCLLGAKTMNAVVFQNFRSLGLVEVSNFFDRLEAIAVLVYLMAGIVHTTVSLSAAASGAQHLLRMPSRRTLLLPISLLAFSWALAPFKGSVEMFDFIQVFTPVAPVLQVLLPLLVWIFAEVKAKKRQLPTGLQQAEEAIEKMEEEAKAPGVPWETAENAGFGGKII